MMSLCFSSDVAPTSSSHIRTGKLAEFWPREDKKAPLRLHPSHSLQMGSQTHLLLVPLGFSPPFTEK